MSVQPTFEGHPDAVFGPGKPAPASKPGKGKGALITEEIAGLAASLAVPVENGQYEPDAFVKAIKARHDTLVEVTAMLKKQNEEQRAKVLELQQREAAVLLREKRCAAVETLTPGGKSWWRLG